MDIQRIGFVCPVPDIADAIRVLGILLGAEPSLADGGRWAQFDVAGARIALAGSDRFSDAPGLMIKVADCDAAVRELGAAGLDVGPVVSGPHEQRAQVTIPGGWIAMLYSSAR
jgi:hypothetical protein